MQVMYQLFYVILLFNFVNTIPLTDFFPYGSTANDAALPSNDDSTSGTITLPFAFPYFDRIETKIYISNNGIFSFGEPVSSYNPTAFPISGDMRIIAGFWADIDTTAINPGASQVYYQVHTQQTNRRVLEKADDHVRAYFPGVQGFNSKLVVVGTWYKVPPYPAQTSPLNTFQIALATDETRSFAFFLYHELSWTRAPSSLSRSDAQAGFNAGDGIISVMLPYSRTTEVQNLTQLSNVNVPGLFAFEIDSEEVSSGGCNNQSALLFSPRRVSQLGYDPITITGPCFDNATRGAVKCRFGSISTVDAIVKNRLKAICVSPPSSFATTIELSLSLDGGNTFRPFAYLLTYSSADYGYSPFGQSKIEILYRPSSIIFVGDVLTFSYFVDQSKFDDWPTSVEIEAEINFIERNISYESINFQTSHTLLRNAPAGVDLQFVTVNMTSFNLNTLKPVFFRVVARDSRTNIIYAGFNSPVFILHENETSSEQFCRTWYHSQPQPTTWNENLVMCPMTLRQAKSAQCCYEADSSCHDDPLDPSFNCAYRQAGENSTEDSAAACYTMLQMNRFGATLKCCYNNQSQLIIRGQAAGSVTRHSTSVSKASNFLNDEIPFIACCFLSNDPNDCALYQTARPIPRGSNTDHIMINAFGDPHFITADGFFYTFNGFGEYTYLAIVDSIISVGRSFNSVLGSLLFESQIRTKPLHTDSLNASLATAITGFSAKSNHPMAERISITISRREEIVVRRGNQTIDFSPINSDSSVKNRSITYDYPEMKIIYNPIDKVLKLMWFIGISFEVKEILLTSFQPSIRILNIAVSISGSYKNRTLGLVGIYDGNPNNDLQSSDGSVMNLTGAQDPTNLYYNFGQTWLINPNRSLFYYQSYESSLYYANQSQTYVPSFNFSNPSTSVNNNALIVCDISSTLVNRSEWSIGQRACYNDYVITGDSTLARMSTNEVNLNRQNRLDSRNPPEFNLSLALTIHVQENQSLVIDFGATSEYTNNIDYMLILGPNTATFDRRTGQLNLGRVSVSLNNTVIKVTATDTVTGLISTHEMVIRVRSDVPSVTLSSIKDAQPKLLFLLLGLFFIFVF